RAGCDGSELAFLLEPTEVQLEVPRGVRRRSARTERYHCAGDGRTAALDDSGQPGTTRTTQHDLELLLAPEILLDHGRLEWREARLHSRAGDGGQTLEGEASLLVGGGAPQGGHRVGEL